MKKKGLIILAAVLAVAFWGYYAGGNIGIPEEKINEAQMGTVSWDPQDCSVIGSSDGQTLYVGVLYRKDYSDAKYFLYVQKGGLTIGWQFLRSGSLSETDGVRAFDCGQYGTAYVALNQTMAVQRIEFEDGRTPAETEPAGAVICEQSKSAVRFYDKDGNEISCSRLTVFD